ncbi:MAG: site-specific integrase [Alistipes sp.]|nr:site-specific integrase [Alistipes sp.]
MATVKVKFRPSLVQGRRGRAHYHLAPAHNNASPQSILLLDFFRTQIEQLLALNRIGTAQNYAKTLQSFSRFLDGEPLAVAELTEQVVCRYNTYLVQRGLVRNSISFYMRVLRAVYNRAVREHLAPQTNPFAQVYTGIDCTRKRAVKQTTIAALNNLPLAEDSPLAFARDIFIFSYCTRGMAFVDIAYLRRSDLRGGVISYTRRKTGQLLTIRIEPAIQRIVDRYRTARSPYIFPIISSLDARTAYQQYKTALYAYNRQLQRLSQMVECECRLTSYTSRHSWATAARDHNVPLSVISAGMGHTSERTTQIYLASLENRVVDNANRDIIGML